MFATFRCFEGFSGPRLQVHHFGAYSVHCYPCYTLVLRARFDVRTEQYRAKFPLCIGLHLHSFTHICRSAPLSTKTFLTVCRLFCLKTPQHPSWPGLAGRPGRTIRYRPAAPTTPVRPVRLLSTIPLQAHIPAQTTPVRSAGQVILRCPAGYAAATRPLPCTACLHSRTSPSASRHALTHRAAPVSFAAPPCGDGAPRRCATLLGPNEKVSRPPPRPAAPAPDGQAPASVCAARTPCACSAVVTQVSVCASNSRFAAAKRAAFEAREVHRAHARRDVLQQQLT